MLRKLYPYGKRKAFNITYDDGVEQDIRFVALLNKFGLKGTFNLNSRLMEEGFQWTHQNGMQVKRLSPDVAVELYKGHEVASHTLTHPYMQSLGREEIMYQLGHDGYVLSQLFGQNIAGFAVPFDYYSPLIADCARELGFEYARMSEERWSYTPPEDNFYWAAGVFHLNPGFADFVNGFFESDEELALCQIVGHSYDLDAENMWEYMEEILRRVAEDEDVLSMTNIEIVRYLNAMRCAEFEYGCIRNNSGTELWFEIDGEVLSLKPWDSLYY